MFACIYLHHMCAVPLNTRQGIRFPITGVTDRNINKF